MEYATGGNTAAGTLNARIDQIKRDIQRNQAMGFSGRNDILERDLRARQRELAMLNTRQRAAPARVPRQAPPAPVPNARRQVPLPRVPDAQLPALSSRVAQAEAEAMRNEMLAKAMARRLLTEDERARLEEEARGRAIKTPAEKDAALKKYMEEARLRSEAAYALQAGQARAATLAAAEQARAAAQARERQVAAEQARERQAAAEQARERQAAAEQARAAAEEKRRLIAAKQAQAFSGRGVSVITMHPA